MSAQNWYKFWLAGRPILCPCIGVHKRMPYMCSSFILWKCSACLLTQLVCKIGGKYSCCFVGCCFYDLFKTVASLCSSHEDLPVAMNDRDRRWEKVREFCVISMTLGWRWLYITHLKLNAKRNIFPPKKYSNTSLSWATKYCLFSPVSYGSSFFIHPPCVGRVVSSFEAWSVMR